MWWRLTDSNQVVIHENSWTWKSDRKSWITKQAKCSLYTDKVKGSTTFISWGLPKQSKTHRIPVS